MFKFIDHKDRIVSLELLRGIAACAVMLFHFTIEESIHLSDNNLLRSIGSYGHYGVEVFFIISGFVIPWSIHRAGYKMKTLGKFLAKRCVRIEIPYFSIILLEIILMYVSSLTPWRDGLSDRLNVQDILLHIGYLNGFLGKPWLLPVFWTLAVEFQFYLLIALLYGLLVHPCRFWRLSVVLLLGASSLIVGQPYIFFHHSLYFVIGILLFQYKTKLITNYEYLLINLTTLCIIYYQSGFILGLICSLTIFTIFNYNQEWKGARQLGAISYSIYLVHIPFGGRLLLLTQKFVGDELLKSLLILSYLLMTIFVAWLFYKFIEKPSMLLSKSISYKTNTTKKIALSNGV